MKKRSIYKKDQAIEIANDLINKSSKQSSNGFERARKYHHVPEKLKNFTSYVAYFHWSNELYSASFRLISLLREIYDKAEAAKSNWYDNKVNLNNILDDYDQLKSDLNNLYEDISEFQNCMLATDISEKQAQIGALSDQVRQIGTLENKIIETCNRKLYEISSSRITYANLSLALVALFVSILSAFCSSR